MRMGKRVLVIGSTCVDVIIRVDHLPHTEENLHPAGQRFSVGGCAYNTANILGRGGADTVFVTPVGLRGVYGPYLKPLLEKQPWIRPVYLENEENGCCYCLVEPDGERTFLSIHGAEYSFSSRWMEFCGSQHFDYAYVCGLEIEEKTGDELITWLSRAHIGTIMYSPGPRGMNIPLEKTERLLSLHPMLHLNRREALQAGNSRELPDALENLRRRTHNTVIATLGADGAVIADKNGKQTAVPGVQVSHIADTIGAGDAHAGALLLGLSKGLQQEQAVAFANRAAAEAVMQEGATLSEEAFGRVMLFLPV